MALAHRVIPTILCRGRTLVKGRQFNSWRTVGLAAQAVRIHGMRGVDEICLLDIGATPDGRGPDLDLVEELTENLFCPLAVGGGIRTIQDVKDLLRAGADKVVIGTAAWESDLVERVADVVGRQAVVAAVDAREHRVNIRCGTVIAEISPKDWAIWLDRHGAGEILLTDIEREGCMTGYNLELVAEVSKAVSVPVIANGGCGSYEHMIQAIRCGASAVAAGAFFQFEEATPRAAASRLRAAGIEARAQ